MGSNPGPRAQCLDDPNEASHIHDPQFPRSSNEEIIVTRNEHARQVLQNTAKASSQLSLVLSALW